MNKNKIWWQVNKDYLLGWDKLIYFIHEDDLKMNIQLNESGKVELLEVVK